MAAKKKSPQSSNAAEKRVSSSRKATVIKPTAAFTNVGQKATGLANAKPGTRGMATAKTPVKKAGQGFAGSGGSLGQSLAMSRPGKPSNIINAALAAAALPGSGSAVRAAIASRYGAVADEAAFSAFGSKIAASTGQGGRVARTMTPFGPTIRSTVIGTRAQQGARIENLLAGVEKGAVRTGAKTASVIASDLAKAGRVVKGAATAALAAQVVAPKVKKRSKKK